MVKIKVHPLTYLLLLSILLCGYFNYFLIISLILFFHDLGHIIVMLMFKIRIYNIIILPFGSLIKSKIKYNISSNKLLLIAVAGISMQIILFMLFYFLYNMGLISSLSYKTFNYYNKYIIIFNILPIIPLDGSKILLSLIERICPYKCSLKMINYLSILLIMGFIMLNLHSFNGIMIAFYLLLKVYEEIFNHKYIFNSFLLERYLNALSFNKIKYINSVNKIYKNRFNFINNEKETSFLAKMFDKYTYF